MGHIFDSEKIVEEGCEETEMLDYGLSEDLTTPLSDSLVLQLVKNQKKWNFITQQRDGSNIHNDSSPKTLFLFPHPRLSRRKTDC